jgi:peptidoglycan/LPS O-acetylase OafA/YrhL
MQDRRGSADSHKTTYRPDLDGLRAIAVLSVIAFHLSAKLLPGGYLGVDIFFVLSGYLITNVIWRESLNNEFTLARFYERRVRRIQPALLALLVVVSITAIVLLLPVDLLGFAKSTFACLTFSANIYFWRDTTYFSQLALEKPLLHVWSLGVEEQFYILFPLLVVACVRWRRSALLKVTFALVLLSLLANVLAIKVWETSPAFYLLPTRAWELGAGAILALLPVPKNRSPQLRNILGLVVVALLVAGLYFNLTFFEGLVPNALWVVLGTTLAIQLANAGSNWLTSGLSSKALVWIGLISYSLYLWHWPILVFAHYYFVQSTLSDAEIAGSIALMFTLATLSWRFVERPFRDRSMPIRTVLAWVGCGCLLAALPSIGILASKGFPSRFSGDVARINAAVGSEYRCSLKDYATMGSSKGCFMSLPSHNPADAIFALIGNSHAQMYAPLVTEIVQANHEGGILIPLSGCLPLTDLNISSVCMTLAARNLELVESLPSIRVVIIGMTWEGDMYTRDGQVPHGRESEFIANSLDRFIQELEQQGKIVVLIGPIAVPNSEVASIVARQLAFHHRVIEPLYRSEAGFIAGPGAIIKHYASRTDIIFIRPEEIQCEVDKCDFFRDGLPLFADTDHIAQAALPFFRPVFEPALQKAFTQITNSAQKQ